MTAVIGAVRRGTYGRSMAVRDGVRGIARTLQRPEAGYPLLVARARTAAAVTSGEAARQLDVFTGRITGLTLEELRELHDETFAAPPVAAIGELVAGLVRDGASLPEARGAADALAPALARLELDRNPFTYVVKALCCLLLTVPHSEESPCPGPPVSPVSPSLRSSLP